MELSTISPLVNEKPPTTPLEPLRYPGGSLLTSDVCGVIMQIDRLEFLGILERVKAGLSTKAMIEQTDHFCFQEGHVYTYNDRISVCHPIDLDEIDGAVNADSLLKLLKRYKTKAVSVEVEDGVMNVRSGKTKEAQLSLADITLPIETFEEPGEEEDLPGDFVQALERCMHSVSKDVNKPILTCLHYGNGCVYGSDGKQLTRYVFTDGDDYEETFNIPVSCIKSVVKFRPTVVMQDDTWIHFHNETETILSVRSMEGKYMTDKCDLLIDEMDYDEIVFPVDILDVLNRADIFAKDIVSGFARVTVYIMPGTTEVISGNEYGNYAEKLKNTYQGPEFEFSFPPGMLMGVAEDDIDNVGIGSKKILIETEDYTHVISLIRG